MLRTMIKELFEFDNNHKNETVQFVIGTDEAGRGPGAGPVFAAAVAFTKYDDNLMEKLSALNDSKQISEKTREMLFDVIVEARLCEVCVYSIHQAGVEEIEQKNILNASLDTMKLACIDVAKQLKTTKVKILIDGNKRIKNFQANMEPIVKGDSKSAAIAAASILAKVSRDRFMAELDSEFPQYGWAKNKGYLSPQHIEAIEKHGITKWHRKKFLRNILENQNKVQQLSLI